jgi:hypothetical protein
VSTQKLPHSVKPLGQLRVHVPAAQVAVPPLAAQTVPQPPQFSGSEVVSKQTPPGQVVSPAWHAVVVAQAAEEHAATFPGYALQTVAQLPQCVGEVVRSLHAPLQSVRGGVHEAMHAPPLHLSAPQFFVHEPQCEGAVRSSSQPFDATPSQSPHPGSHAPTTQAPAEQPARP